ncbi:unnamed protein product [Lupinus luteus]|uniref:Pectinesterase inhibitor domain-containing protein n=1 Tax=Lupinus luteus TaxID=3873 RepID=A0AAV1XS06_LUPLU
MARSNSFALILILQALFFIISIQARHPITFHPDSDPEADIWGLGALMVNDMERNAKAALAKIDALQRAKIGPKAGLDSCRTDYNTILVAAIPKAREALKKRDTKISEGPLNDAFNKVKKCETNFPRNLTPENNLLRDSVGYTIHIFVLTGITG